MAEEKEKLGWKMNKIGMLLISMLFLSLAVVIKPVAGGATVVKVDPSSIEYHENATGQQFTVAIKIVDVTNLYGFDMVLQWNTTFLAYVSHSTRVPKDAYSDGVLWNPVYPIEDQVNSTTGTYWIAFACIWPAPTFNGSGTVFTITFQIIYQPVQPQPDANITLHLYSSTSSSPDLSNNIGQSIPHSTQDGTVILYALSGGSHDVAVTDIKSSKTVIGQGYGCNITVVTQNHGGYAETYNITLHANETEIATKLVTVQVSGTATVDFTWNTSNYAFGNYRMWAYAWPVLGETNTANNNFTDGTVTIAHVGDITADGKCDIQDLARVSAAFGSVRVNDPNNPRYGQYWHTVTCSTCPHTPNADITNDGKIDIQDLARTSANFGWHE